MSDDDLQSCLASMSTSAILSLFPDRFWSTKTRRNRELLVNELLLSDASTRRTILDFHSSRAVKDGLDRKRKREDKVVDDEARRRSKLENKVDTSDFPTIRSDKDIWSRIQKFSNHLSNRYTEQVVCMVCAGRVEKYLTKHSTVTAIPNRHLLAPSTPHLQHFCLDGLLFHRGAVKQQNGNHEGFICDTCTDALKKNKKPKFSLANNMWIGDIPFELSRLTIPERMLIAIYYPSAYIIKLYPKVSFSKKWKNTEFQDGLRGNVATYRLNPKLIADLVRGSPFPRPIEILASTISLTLVGPKGRPDKYLRESFQVRRRVVYESLVWLKENNPFYTSIEVNMATLSSLPECDIPDSIISNLKNIEEDEETYKDEVFEDDEREDGIGQAFEEMDDDYVDNYVFNESAVIDVEASSLGESELVLEALSNMATTNSQQQPIKVFRDSQFINEYPRYDQDGRRFAGSENNPNIFLGAFPYLFPYGMGGFETNREVYVSFQEHAQWALRYDDSRFTSNISFLAQVFGIIQKRNVCNAAELQINKSSYLQHEMLLKTITPADFQNAIKEELNGKFISHKGIRTLLSLVKATRRSVLGTDESRINIRQKIYGLNLMKSPPFLWMTLNFDLNDDPLVQIYAGRPVNMDNFLSNEGPSSRERYKIAVNNPYACVRAFHRNVTLVLQDLIGMRCTPNGRILREEGIFGLLEAYVGIVEAQGRGNLHLHLLVWLRGTPNSNEMLTKLQDVSFRRRLEKFISIHVKSHVSRFEELNNHKESREYQEHCKEMASAYSRPLDPTSEDFTSRLYKQEFYFAKSHQLHSCTKLRCLKKNHLGKIVCKRGAPWQLSEKDVVLPTGEWTSKRENPFFNSWNPFITFATRSNNDIKILTNGSSTRHITFYITKYAAKRQNRSYNTSALLASRMVYLKPEPSNIDLRKANIKLLSQCSNTLSREQELSAQQIISYIGGWGDRYLSHRYVPIFWTSAIRFLESNFGEFRKNKTRNKASSNGTTNKDVAESDDGDLRLEFSSSTLSAKSQIRDYMYRGVELENYNFLNFLLETYEPRKHSFNEDTSRSRRVPYLTTDALYRERVRIIRQPDSDMIPDFLGCWIPRNDVPECFDFYCASILLLLKPWRTISQLKPAGSTWASAFATFKCGMPPREIQLLENFQYYYQSSDDAEQHRLRVLDQREEHTSVNTEEFETVEAERVEFDIEELALDFEKAQHTKQKVYRDRDDAYSNQSVDIFNNALNSYPAPETNSSSWPKIIRATNDIHESLQTWNDIVNSYVKDGHFISTTSKFKNPTPQEILYFMQKSGLSRVNAEVNHLLDQLTGDQRRACDIVDKQLLKYLNNEADVDPLYMLITGSGGVGKSVVINALKEIFRIRSSSDKLAITATTGIAAAHVGGFTLHWWAGIPVRKPQVTDFKSKSSNAIIRRRENNMFGKLFLIIDEVSMLDQETLGYLSKIISLVMDPENQFSFYPFGGRLNVIMVGDFHQFPPPLKSHLALYKLPPSDSIWANIGHNVFQLFDVVVILQQQMRVDDERWNQILTSIRSAQCDSKDLDALNEMVLTHHDCNIPNFYTSPWFESTLVTPRHSTREKWNQTWIRFFCKIRRKRLLICPSENYVGKRIIEPHNEDTMLWNAINGEQKSVLPLFIELAEGIPAVITWNISVNAELANGTLGTIERIIVDHREPSISSTDMTVRLHYPPVVILFKPYQSTFPPLPGLSPGIIPIQFSNSRYSLSLPDGRKVNITRHQYPILPAFAITDYRSQSQTIKPVIVDIGNPPNGGISQFNAYVALSRGVSRTYTRLLRPFDPKLFMNPVDEDLQRMEIWLMNQNQKSKSN